MKYVILKVGTMSAIDINLYIQEQVMMEFKKVTTNDYSDKIRECSKTINSHKRNKKKTHQKSRTVFLEFLSAPASIRSRAQSA
jgi:hypothetical protein